MQKQLIKPEESSAILMNSKYATKSQTKFSLKKAKLSIHSAALDWLWYYES